MPKLCHIDLHFNPNTAALSYAIRRVMRSIISISIVLFSLFVQAGDAVELETQILEPTGGRIEKPKDWFYRERHGGPYLVWILSKEDPDIGPYKTGVKIQLIPGIKEKSGQTAEAFLRKFADSRKASVRVLSECKAQDQGFFTRICLETLEPAPEFGEGKKFRIQYSLFWGNSMDMAIVMVAGTLEELWPENQQIFNSMQAFEIIDMKRFE